MSASIRMGLTEPVHVTEFGADLVLLSVEAPSSHPARRVDDTPLTPAERAVVELALSGHSNQDIARRRGCSPSTVANQLASAYAKLGLRGRRELRAGLSGGVRPLG